MKYQANPVVVEAFRVTGVHPKSPDVAFTSLALENGEEVQADSEMLCRLPEEQARVGDYWVIQADGYVYLNPGSVFERKYSPLRTGAEKAA